MRAAKEWTRYTGPEVADREALYAAIQADAREDVMRRVAELEAQVAEARDLLLATDDAEMLFSWHAQVYDWLERTAPKDGK